MIKLSSGEAVASSTERQFWLLDQQGLGSAYNIISAFKHEELNFELFKMAVQKVYGQLGILRSTYSLANGSLIRKTHDHELVVVEKYFQEDSKESRYWFESLCQKPFDLAAGPLVRLVRASFSSSNIQYVAVVIHHIVIDLRTKDLIGGLLLNYYRDDNSRINTDSASPKASYLDYCSWQSDWLASESSSASKEYWRSELESIVRGVNIATKKSVGPAGMGVVTLGLSDDLNAGLSKYAKANNSSSFILLLTAYYYVLSKYCLESNFAIGVPLSNRKQEVFHNVAGCFVNTVPIKILAEDSDNFSSLVKKTRKALLLAHRHQDLPTIEIHEQLPGGRQGGAVYQHGFTFEHPMSIGGPEMGFQSVSVDTLLPQLELLLRCRMEDGIIVGQLEYNCGLYTSRFAERFIESMRVFIDEVLKHPRRSLSQISYMPPRDKKIISKVNNTFCDFGEKKTLQQSFEEQVVKTPDAIALVAHGESVTYSQFNARANHFAYSLHELGVKAGDVVALLSTRSIAMMEALYGIIKSGAIYLPLDVESPEPRVNYMLKQAGAVILVVESSLETDKHFQVDRVASLEAIKTSFGGGCDENPRHTRSEDDLAYIIFTSGSTGLPKGVMNSHAGIFNRMQWMQERFNYGVGDVVLQKTPYSFDVSLVELFWPLQVGATLAVADHDSHKDPYQLDNQIREFNVNLIHFVPAMLASFLSMDINAQPSIKAVMCSGEELSLEHQEKFYKKYPDATLYNMYGPTEAAVEVTFWECPRNYENKYVPIGTPVHNTKLYVVDDDCQQVPVGLMGELWIGGDQVAEGYVGSPDLTAERFVSNPFDKGSIYKTGDYVRWSENGSLEYLGRKDFQVKINGVRIELSEIESALLKHEDIALCVATAEKKNSAVTYLQAFYSTKSGNKLDQNELIKHLKNYLPTYVVPTRLYWTNDFILTSSGKIDRKKLPAAPEMSTKASNEPLNNVQIDIMFAWTSVLEINTCGLDESFFEVGGDSISLMSVFSKLKERYAPRLRSVDLFSYPTIRSLSLYLSTDVSCDKDVSVSKERASKIRRSIKGGQRTSRNRRPRV
jgi:amino acid adenylation domain-containing protein